MVEDWAGWTLAWSDEFDGRRGSLPDSTVWQAEIGGHGWGNDELQYYTDDDENAEIDGASNLAISVRRVGTDLQDTRFDGREYTSARLISKDRLAFTYGLVRARIRIPPGRGVWPAFWMLGQNIESVGWPQCGEIDVMENFCADPTAVRGTVHGPGYSGRSGVTSHGAGASLADDFHVYSVSWEPDRISWYLDDELYGAVTPRDLRGNPWVFDHDFFLLINVAVGGAFSELPDRSVSFPQSMLVDYVRVYTDRAAPVGPLLNSELAPPRGA